jgi:Protein of unknown function (DUF2889)
MTIDRLAASGASSLRRTTTVDACADGTWQRGVRLVGRGRDLVTDADGSSWSHATQTLVARVDSRGRLLPDSTAGLPTVPVGLAGVTARRGFRRALGEHLERTGEAGGLEAALLDEMPGMQIISGYAQVHELSLDNPVPRGGPGLGVCTGWKADGHAASHSGAVVDMLSDRPAAGDLVGQDESVWHRDPPPPHSSMRRRRLVEITPGVETSVYAYFRDTYTDPAGTEVIVHEYEVDARVGGTPIAVLDLEARPGALPLPDCPGAAPGVLRLRGVGLDGFEATVRSMLTGPQGCTHLNDLLRTLRLVEPLTETFRMARQERSGAQKETTP